VDAGGGWQTGGGESFGRFGADRGPEWLASLAMEWRPDFNAEFTPCTEK